MNQLSIDRFLDRLASADPTPGGGSAAAIMGAMGAALVSMVCNVSFGKKGYEAAEPELRNILARSEELRSRLAAMVAEDVAAFDSLMAAYKLPKSSEEEKSHRAETIQSSLKHATHVPLECARACSEVVLLARRAALRSAALNVFINAPSLKDRRFAETAIAEVERLVGSSAADSATTYAAVRSKLES
jgi:methenyltetrahydrofolate cyclohydrolase